MRSPAVAALFALLATAMGCSVPRASYAPPRLDPGELALVAPGPLVILEGQQGAPPRALSLDDLRAAVGCVPDAVGFADAATSIRATGTVMKWIGWAAAITGIAFIAYSVVQNDDRFYLPAVSVASSGALLTQMPQYLAPFVLTKAIDAVHAFEDQKVVLPACGATRPAVRPPAPPPPMPPAPGGPKPGDGPGGPRS